MDIRKLNGITAHSLILDNDLCRLFLPLLIQKIDEKISQIVINECGDETAVIVSTRLNLYYFLTDGCVQEKNKDEVLEAKFVKGMPHGSAKILFSDGKYWNLNDIIAGRVFDFVQDVKPKRITSAGYDNTIRGESPQLLDPDHADEIDRLRKWMQEGHMSHYEYDDANPGYSKAGK